MSKFATPPAGRPESYSSLEKSLERRRKQEQHERKLIATRRSEADVPPNAPVAALALSGGGIRSATFCLGLIRRMASNGVLLRFDYLSTVSGGGFIGGALGRLFCPNETGTTSHPWQVSTAKNKQEKIASPRSLFLWWLRSNGRYLTPAGVQDKWIAFSTAARAFLETQLEVAGILAFISIVVLLPHAFLVLLQSSSPIETIPIVEKIPSLWWWLSLFPAFIATAAAAAYGFSTHRNEDDDSLLRTLKWEGVLLTAALLLTFGVAWVTHSAKIARIYQGPLLLGVIAFLAATIFGIALEAQWMWRRKALPAERRMKYIRYFSASGAVFALFLINGTVEYASWWVVVHFQEMRLSAYSVLALTTAIIVSAIRATGPKFTQRAHQKGMGETTVQKILNAVGYFLVSILLFLSCAIVTEILFFFSDPIADTARYQWWLGSAPLIKCAIGLAFIYIFFFINRDFQHLNLSSLHYLYRARISRTYVSIGNSRRFPDSPLEPANELNTKGIKKVTDTNAHDEIDLDKYRPHDHGGPIHLINCCINQTIDDRTGNYNADRKGVALTVSALGVEEGTNFPVDGHLKGTTLSQWLAISGAAIGTGMGRITSKGLSALIFLTGLRIGYWSTNLLPEGEEREKDGRIARWLEKWSPRAAVVFAEMFAAFPGLRNSRWYLSDGGFFDNTGVYALLKRQVDFIVLADCGQDVNYLFFDVENLVRKAFIDYSAKIEFMDPVHMPIADAVQVPPESPASCFLSASVTEQRKFKECFGTPDSIDPAIDCTKFLICARVTYTSGKIGTLLIVKPRRIKDLPFDIVAYSDRAPTFPQQPTANQFFSEEQWESYQHLGWYLGKYLTQANFDFLSYWARNKEYPILQLQAHVGSKVENLETGERQASRRERVVKAIGATVGVGLSATVIFSLWQGYQQFRGGEDAKVLSQDAAYDSVMKTLADATTAQNETQLQYKLAQFIGSRAPNKRGQAQLLALQQSLEKHCAAVDTPALCKAGAYKRYFMPVTSASAAALCYWGGANSLLSNAYLPPGAASCRVGQYPAVVRVREGEPHASHSDALKGCSIETRPDDKPGVRPQVSVVLLPRHLEKEQHQRIENHLQKVRLVTDVRSREVDTDSALYELFPSPWGEATRIFYSADESAELCAKALSSKFSADVTPLPLGITQERGVVEVFFPYPFRGY